MHAPMEIFLSFTKTSMATILALFITLLASLLWATRTILTESSRNKKKAAVPEAGGAWPLIGHLHLLGGPQPAHIVLGNMADTYGPIFTIKAGVHRALVISDQEIAKECFTTNDKAFANRPKTIASEVLGYDGAMFGFSPYGPFWREMRKIATLELLSNQRLEMFKHVREEEVRTLVNALHKLCTIESSGKVLVEMKRWFGDVTLNVIMKIIFGKSVGYMGNIRENDLGRWKKALMEFTDLFGRFVVGDAVPFLRWFDVGGHEKAMRKIAKELDVVVEAWLMEHKEKRSGDGAFKSEDFMDLMLSILHDVNAQVLLGYDSDTINKATCLGLILAASNTTTATLTWALSLLLNHPNILSKTQLELDNNVGRERQVNESDLKNLVYLKAVIKETQRLYPAGPLSLPHEAMEDTTIAEKYHVPAGTRLFTNLWKIQRDARVWPNPNEFQPERFLTTHQHVDVRGHNFELMPFGSGRRMCPGVSFALQAMELTLATLLHGFDFKTPSDEPVDMIESIGLANPRATPLEVYISPRLPPYLYD